MPIEPICRILSVMNLSLCVSFSAGISLSDRPQRRLGHFNIPEINSDAKGPLAGFQQQGPVLPSGSIKSRLEELPDLYPRTFPVPVHCILCTMQ